MQLKYKLAMTVIVLLLTLTFTIGTSYGIYKAINKEKDYISVTNNCIEMVTDSKYITSEKLPILDVSDSTMFTPETISFTNICQTSQDLEIRLNILEDSSVNTQELKVSLNGSLTLEPTIYSSLINSNSNKKNNQISKIIGNISLNSQETKRLNIRLWLDSTRSTKENQNIKAQIEFTTEKTIIKPIFKDTLLTNNTTVTNSQIDFSLTETTNSIIGTIPDSEGNSYYFRGPVTNNYVLFANKIWRIIRINGDGSIRLIYDDEPIIKQQFNEAYNHNIYLGYTYEIENEESSSHIKTFLEEWYQENLKEYENYIANTKFCNDTSFTETYGIEYYGAYNRLTRNPNPSLKCTNPYEEKIGLITADEVILAGGNYNRANNNYYLNSGYSFYTMSPSRFSNSVSYMMIVNNYGSLKDLAINQYTGIRPVISLETIVSVSGSGTKENPYTIDKLEA